MPWSSDIPRDTTWPTTADAGIGGGVSLIGQFEHTGSLQTFEVTPDMIPGVFNIVMRGGRGACAMPYNLGNQMNVSLTNPWEAGTWTVMVAGDAIAYQGGYGGGGDGGLATGALFTDGGGGGGATVIWDPQGVPRAWAGGTGGAAGGVVPPTSYTDLATPHALEAWLAARGMGFFPTFITYDNIDGVAVSGYGPSPLDAGSLDYSIGSHQVIEGQLVFLNEAAGGVFATGARGAAGGQGGNMKYDRDPTCEGAPGSTGNGYGAADSSAGWALVHNLYTDKAVWGASADLYPATTFPPYWHGRGGNGGDLTGTGMQGPGGGGGGGGCGFPSWGGGGTGGGGGGAANFVQRFDPIIRDDGTEYDWPVAYTGVIGIFSAYWGLGPGGHGNGAFYDSDDARAPYSDGDGNASWWGGQPWRLTSPGAILSAAHGRAIIGYYPTPPEVQPEPGHGWTLGRVS